MSPLQERLRGIENGRPFLFVVQRDAALEAGDAADVAAVSRRAELWERPPEEWELARPVSKSRVSRARRMQNFVDGLAEEYREQREVITTAHMLVGVTPTPQSIAVALQRMMDPTRRTSIQIASFLADYMMLPNADGLRATAARERHDNAMRSAYRDAALFGTAILPTQFGARS